MSEAIKFWLAKELVSLGLLVGVLLVIVLVFTVHNFWPSTKTDHKGRRR